MANLIMTNWYIEDKTPPIVIGTAGENNATPISIQCDSVIENAEYFLDIGDEKDGLPNTQELTVKQQTTPTGETIDILYLKPMRSFLGKEGVKLLQVRCEYVDENQEKVTQESNVIHAIVSKNSGFIYKFDIAVFQQYLNKVKDIVKKVTNTLVGLDDVNITNPTDGQVVKYDATSQKWINGEGGGSSLQNVVDAVVSGKSGGVLLNNTANNTAKGNYATAEGSSTTAEGDYSHAEGVLTGAVGDGSHAEGNYSGASGDYSHAEGYRTIASGQSSHSEGSNTTASGEYAHSEGYNTTASGDYSHTQGYYTIAQGQQQTTIGKYNIAQGSNRTYSSTDYAFIIGNGTSNNSRSNALAIKWDGTFVFANGTEITPAQFAQLKALLN